MSITRLQSVPKASRIVIHNDTVYLSGQVGTDLSSNLETQARQILEQIDQHLATAGTDRSKLLSAVVFVKDIRHVDTFNKVWIDWLGGANQPARTCVQAEMGLPEILAEVTVIAAR